jgi:hypothetical protein
MGGANTHRGKRAASVVLVPSRQVPRQPSLFGKLQRQLLGRDRLMRAHRAGSRTLAAPSSPRPGRQRLHPGLPQAGGGLDADDIGKTDLNVAVAKVGVIAVSLVGQRDFGIDPGAASHMRLIKRDLRLGLKDNIVGHAGPARRAGL